MSAGNQSPGGPAEPAAELKAAILGRIRAAGDALQRADGLDEEQRAEIQAILDALAHASGYDPSLVGTWVSHSPAERSLDQHFVDLLEAAEACAREYDRLAAATPEAPIREQFVRLARLHRRHAEQAGRLLEIVGASE